MVKLFAMPAATLGSNGERLTDFDGLRGSGAVGFGGNVGTGAGSRGICFRRDDWATSRTAAV